MQFCRLARLKTSHILLAILTAALWGTNFVVIKHSLTEIPPLLLSSLRFFFSAVPFVFFIPKPKTSFKLLVGYGLSIFTLQFGFLFSGMKLGVPAGLASLVLQTQVFFTIGLAAFLMKERPPFFKILGALIAFGGISIVGFHTDGDVSLVGLILLLFGAASWAIGNLVSKKIGPTPALGLVVWGNLIATPPMILFCLMTEGIDLAVFSLSQISMSVVGCMMYIVYASTLIGFSLWSFLLSRYPAATVAPFTLLVPIFGFLGSMIFLGEPMPMWKLHTALLVVIGLAVNLFGHRLKKLF